MSPDSFRKDTDVAGTSGGTIVVIPARHGSERLPGKPLLRIGGEPMIVRVWRRCSRVTGTERVVVATDDERIRAAVADAGGEAVMTSASHQSGTDRVAAVVRDLKCEVVVNVQGDEPFIEPAAVEMTADLVRGEDAPPVGTLACPVASLEELADPAVVKVVISEGGEAVYFSRLPVPFVSELWDADGRELRLSQDVSWEEVRGRYYRHVGIYAFKPAYLQEFAARATAPAERAEGLEQLRILETGGRIGVAVSAYCGQGVDTAEGLEKARRRAEVEE